MGYQRVARSMVLVLIAVVLLGCEMKDIADQFYGFEATDAAREEAAEKKRRDQEKKAKVAQQEAAAGTERTEGNYRLVFSGENRTGTDFDAPNRTPGMLTATGLTAREVYRYTVGPAEAPVPAKQAWTIEATRDGSRITGTVVSERWIGQAKNVVITNTDTGETRVEANPNPDPATTVTWKGTLQAVVDADGTMAGTVKGTFSNSTGFSAPFTWELTGDPTK